MLEPEGHGCMCLGDVPSTPRKTRGGGGQTHFHIATGPLAQAQALKACRPRTLDSYSPRYQLGKEGNHLLEPKQLELQATWRYRAVPGPQRNGRTLQVPGPASPRLARDQGRRIGELRPRSAHQHGGSRRAENGCDVPLSHRAVLDQTARQVHSSGLIPGTASLRRLGPGA